jgi:cyclophilin family peptidyl-prolyl cis-trans isomerase
MKRAVTLLLVLVVLAVGGYFGFAYWQQRQATATDIAPAAAEPATTTSAAVDTATAPVTTAAATAAPAGTYDLTVQADGMSKAIATLTMEKGEVAKFRFYTNDAPNTAKRIAQLISEGFYNGILVHRVEPGFVVQAGDPTGTGASGSGVKLKAEFNSRKHEPGIWSMARLPSDVDSADSQFFVMLGAAPSLDNQYTIFGKVVEGFENIQKIQRGDKIKTFTIQ